MANRKKTNEIDFEKLQGVLYEHFFLTGNGKGDFEKNNSLVKLSNQIVNTHKLQLAALKITGDLSKAGVARKLLSQ